MRALPMKSASHHEGRAMLMRSKLFVPATRPELFAKAEGSLADSLSFALEDAVTEERKDEARQILSGHLRGRAP